ncbi:hypothetical protein CKALI_04320 [Corynebacterium kalinowskii]|uniref:Uncharacterized protein n=1 Tax=Corynebacterium kalinowskii TaxID=2675216 RepID=A0A6B8VC68_9CORY|nr:hypothetical protein [Corynebacterium kalinowskii]QGU01743.1 hypothetical protein CKALI_04320 [Corynebacterium kalinowskii]
MKLHIPALIVAAALLVGCDNPLSGTSPAGSDTETATQPATEAATESATPTTKAESKGSAADLEKALGGSGGALATGPDDFRFVEEYVAQLRGVVTPEVRVNADPKGMDKLVAVKIPHTLPDDEIKRILDAVQPLAADAQQTHGITTHVGDQVGPVLATAEAVSYESQLLDLKKEWDMVMGTVPIMEGKYEYSRLTALWLIAADFTEHTNETCVDNLRYLHGAFEDEKLKLGDRELLLKQEGCGGKFVVIHGDPGVMQDKIENLANLLAVPNLVPEGSKVRVQYNADLEVVTPGALDPGLKEKLDKEWHQGEVIVSNM